MIQNSYVNNIKNLLFQMQHQRFHKILGFHVALPYILCHLKILLQAFLCHYSEYLIKQKSYDKKCKMFILEL